MHRKALIFSLGLALVFAALPGIASFSFAGSSGGSSGTTSVPVTVVDGPFSEEHQLAFGLDNHGDCPFADTATDSSRF